MLPQDLVCAGCWRDFFNTEDYEKCCTFGPSYKNGHSELTEVVAVCDLKNARCGWCQYIRSFFGDSLGEVEIVTAQLSPDQLKSATPIGRNIFYLCIYCRSPTGEVTSSWSPRIHAWAEGGDVAADYVTARPVRTDVNSEASRGQIRTWLEDCTNHTGCHHMSRSSKLPARVIEVSPPGQENPRLLESGTLTGMYVALSYCWGKTPFRTLTEHNYDTSLEELELSTLPATFRDVISIARDMSIPYLWIDALCIIQDSEEDKTTEIAGMKQIYESSALTIVAASSNSVFDGILYPRVHSEPSCAVPFRIRHDTFGTMFVNDLDDACYDELLEPIVKRAWTMQEQLLAPRTLPFTTRTMRWTCRAGTRNFGDSLYFPHDLGSGYNDEDEKYSLNLNSLLPSKEIALANKDKALSCWMRLITAYSLRTASHERDKLNALAGIASHPSFFDALGPTYFAGLWQYSFARQLLWYTSERHRTLPEDETFVYYRPSIYRAPSWSWASLEGGVIHYDFVFDDDYEENPDIICEIMERSTTPASAEVNPLGEVVSGRLRIKGAVRRAWFNHPTENVYMLASSDSGPSNLEFDPSEEQITFAEASVRYMEDFIAQNPDVDLVEEPETAHGTSSKNMCGTHDEGGEHDPLIVFCVAVTLSNKYSRV